MKYLSVLFLLFAYQCVACEENGNLEDQVFGKILGRDGDAFDIAIYYPNEFKGAELQSVSFIYFKDERFFMAVDSNILNLDSGIKGIDLNKYSWSYIALNPESLSDVEVAVSYNWAPGDDGSVSICGPKIHHRLGDIVKDV